MDLSKLYQKELSYENSLGQTNINTFTGRVLFKMLDMNFNVDANNLNVLHVYNSNYTYLGFRGQPYGKKWKLNCEQFLYLEDNKYVYEDENGMYVYFEHLTDNRYYDTSGLNYILTIYDNYQELKDPSGKIRKFEDNRLKEVYYEGGTFKKIIEYQNGLLLNIKNTKDPEKLIEFNYKNFLLKEVFFKADGNIVYSLKYFYNENKELIKVNKCVKDVEKTIALFKYDNEKIKYIISLYDKTGLKIEYTNGKATKLSNIEVAISETKHEVSKRIGEMDEFLGEDIYLGDYEVLIKKSFDDSTSNYNVLSYDNFEYITNGLTIQNSKGLKQVLYYDNLGKPISNFEYVTDLTNLKEINMNYGLNMLRGGGYSDKINRRTGVEITKTDNSIKNKNVTFFNNFKTLLNNKYKYNGGEINQLVCSFYIKLLAPITSNIITISFEYASYTKSAYSFIDNNLVGVWQYISIPITIEGYEFTDVKILGLQGEEKIYLNYMKLNVAPESNINIIYNEIKVNLKDAIGITYSDKNDEITNITFSKENYLSIMDLLNMKFYKIINNTNEKLLSYNNGQKKLIFNNAILRLDNKDNKYGVNSIGINDIDFNIEQKNLFNSQEIITRYSLYDDTNIIEETTYKDLNDESNSKTYYKKYDFNFNLLCEGDTLLETDEELFSLTTPYRIVVYEYDENKNLKSKAIQWPCSLGRNEVKEEKTFNKNVISVLETNRKYYSEDKEPKNNSKTNYYYGNDNTLLKVEKIHDVDKNKIIETQNYKYDYYNENVIEVNNNQDKHNYVLYNNKGLPFYYSSNNINSND